MRKFLLSGLTLMLLLSAVACAPKDSIPPEIAEIIPLYGAEEVGLASKISITFTKAMDKASVANAFRIDPVVSGSHSWHGETFTFVPDILFPGTEYVISFSTPPSDTAGNKLQEFSLRFVTATPEANVYEIESFAWLPDSFGLVFSSDKSGTYGIWQVDLASRQQRFLAESTAGLVSPAVSPDGRLIACVSPSSTELYLYNTNSGTMSKHRPDIDTGVLTAPQFSPDGHALALLSVFGYADAHSDIYQAAMLVDLTREFPIFVTVSPTSETDWIIGFTDNSAELYLLSTHDSYNFGRDFRYDFWRVSLQTGEYIRMTDDGPVRNYHSGAYSLQNGWFAASSWVAREIDHTIIESPSVLKLYDLGTLEVQSVIAAGHSAYPAASPKGETLAYVFASDDAPDHWDIYRINTISQQREQLTFSRHVKRGLKFSPDGQYIAFIQIVGESHSIWAMRLDGTELRRLSK